MNKDTTQAGEGSVQWYAYEKGYEIDTTPLGPFASRAEAVEDAAQCGLGYKPETDGEPESLEFEVARMLQRRVKLSDYILDIDAWAAQAEERAGDEHQEDADNPSIIFNTTMEEEAEILEAVQLAVDVWEDRNKRQFRSPLLTPAGETCSVRMLRGGTGETHGWVEVGRPTREVRHRIPRNEAVQWNGSAEVLKVLSQWCDPDTGPLRGDDGTVTLHSRGHELTAKDGDWVVDDACIGIRVMSAAVYKRLYSED